MLIHRIAQGTNRAMLPFGAAVALLASASFGHAATYGLTAVGDGRTYTIVDADTFTSTAGPGNTVRAVSPGTAWADVSTSNTDGLWRDRLHNAFLGSTLTGSAGNLYEVASTDRTAAPEIVTTVTGLAPGQYDVFAAYVIRNDANADSAGITADLGAAATTIHSHNSPFVIPAFNGTSVWDVALSPLGTTADGATGFAANVKGTTSYNRNDYIGLAYIPVTTTPDLNVDFGNSKGTGAGVGGIQTGFSGFEFFENAGTPANTRTFNTDIGQNGQVDVTVSGYTHFRDYSSIVGTNAASGQDPLLSDMVLRNVDGVLTLQFDGLEAGMYDITTFHHSTQFGGGTFDVELTDSNGMDVLLFDDAMVSSGTDPASISSLSFQFTTDGSSPVVIDFLGGATLQHLALNGFQLQQVAVPEPASVAMWLILGFVGCGVAFRRRRRR